MNHITLRQRDKIESLYNKNHSKNEIAQEIGVSLKTVYNELKRGMYTAITSDYKEVKRYSADIAQRNYNYMQTSKGSRLKLEHDYKFVQFVEMCILERCWSPDAIIGYIKRNNIKFDCQICTKTLYNYIDQGLFLNVTNKNLWRKGNKKQQHKPVVRRIKKPLALSIADRPEVINARSEFGHWEMDSVIGKNNTKECLLVMTERLTRYEIILKISSRTQSAVEMALNRLERCTKHFKDIFKTITVDNGGEFLDDTTIQKSVKSKRNRTLVYYCHPYSSWERGSNENQNGIIRRWIPKGTPLELYDHSYVQSTQNWINTYPRKLLDYASSSELFNYYISQF